MFESPGFTATLLNKLDPVMATFKRGHNSSFFPFVRSSLNFLNPASNAALDIPRSQ